MLGGTQSLHTNSRDEALSLPTEESVQIALRTQQIIAHESGVADSIDPLAGSYLIEAWTNEIEERAFDYIDKIDGAGGALRAIEQGYVQREIQESAYRWQLAVEQSATRSSSASIASRQRRMEPPGGGGLELLQVDPVVGERQAARLEILRAQRNGDAVAIALSRLEAGAQGDQQSDAP